MYCVKQKSLAICHQVIQRKGDSGGGVVTTARSGRLSKKVMYTLVAIMSATTVGGVFVRNAEKMMKCYTTMLVDMGHCEHIPDETFRWGTNYVTCVGDFIGWIKKEASKDFFL